MAHYALLDENNIVIQVIVGKDENEDGIDWEQFYSQETEFTCKRTSYNTSNGVHSNGGNPFRKNYAGIGYSYDDVLDAFIPPQNYPSWLLDQESCTWIPPIEYPSDGLDYFWNEDLLEWSLVEVLPERVGQNLYHEVEKNIPSGWSVDEETGVPVPPIPYPEDRFKYFWDTENQTWALLI